MTRKIRGYNLRECRGRDCGIRVENGDVRKLATPCPTIHLTFATFEAMVMDRRGSFDDSLNDQAIPIPIQIFLWRQTRAGFICGPDPCMNVVHIYIVTICDVLVLSRFAQFCQNAPGHHELKEACKTFIGYGSETLYAIKPSSTNKQNRSWMFKSSANKTSDVNSSLGDMRLTHWYDVVSTVVRESPRAKHPVWPKPQSDGSNSLDTTMEISSSIFSTCDALRGRTSRKQVFIFLFAPLCHHLKESDMQSFRLENGLKLWQAIWEYKHPNAKCFTAHCKPKPRTLLMVGDFLLETFCKYKSAWMSSPKEPNFPETIPEESSSTEEEHMVIFKLPSLSDSEGLKESSIYSADASIFQVPVGRNSSSSPRGVLNIEQVTAISGSDTRQYRPRPPQLRTDVESTLVPPGSTPVTIQRHKADLTAATFMDVAVLRCLFLKNWQEEGVYWALQFLYHRLREISDETATQQLPRQRSNSLPIPKIEVSIYQSPELKKRESRVFIDVPDDSSLIGKKQTLASSDGEQVGGATGTHSRSSSQKVKKRMKMADLKAFVETKLLSKSEKTLEKIGHDDIKGSAVFDQ
ncbi:hypothetical protein B566_EDAN005289, partial [Ephemera danica]